MAMFSVLHVIGESLNVAGENTPTSFYFLGAKNIYTNSSWNIATGIKDVTATHKGKVPLTSVGELVKRGILKTVKVTVANTPGYREIRYSGALSKSIDNDQSASVKGVIGLSFPAGSGAKWAAKTITAVSSTELEIIKV
ncbi:hypothetical protein [Sphaerospermopsis sp. LEGE 08334]|uniref:hypothetical protein n=1 Tax=Sphaerospermopsis sp. LEGE 08334 TaxID=1828651 RepID=UPI00187E6FF6|nr:hypothetical protein [Sphaerospermopsis sp. LEGE 08334]MBE9059309.1 hypothetical protein [Sphaerospermopsis sp. LEGE 08334]